MYSTTTYKKKIISKISLLPNNLCQVCDWSQILDSKVTDLCFNPREFAFLPQMRPQRSIVALF